MAALIETFAHRELTAAPWWNTGLVGTAAKTWQDFQKAAGLDWKVAKIPLYWQHPSDGSFREVYERQSKGFAIQRNTDQKILGVVGPQYTPVQNDVVFEWFDPWVKEGIAKFETAGSLKGGEVVWALATLDGLDAEIKKGDSIRRHILLSNSHDGTLALRAGLTDVRVVCWNTLSAAHGDSNGKLSSIRHTKSAEDTLKAIQRSLDTLITGFQHDVEDYKKLAEKGVTLEEVTAYTKEVFAIKEDENTGKISARGENLITLVGEKFRSGMGNTGETWWDAYNGITEVLTYERGSDSEKRLASTWFGDGAEKNRKARELALLYATAA